jgi:hypothetical protein
MKLRDAQHRLNRAIAVQHFCQLATEKATATQLRCALDEAKSDEELAEAERELEAARREVLC